MKSIIRLAAISAILFAGSASADLIQSQSFEGNECGGNGVWGTDCVILDVDGNEVSPFLGKWDSGDGEVTSDAGQDLGFDWDLMTFYYDEARTEEVAGGDWNNLFDQTVGGWSYGGDDDLIRFWVAKAGSAFTLFFYSDGDCSNWNNVDCLAKATAQSEGSWNTAELGGSELSHLSFYDGAGTPPPPPPPPPSVPEPGTLALLGLGLIGIGASRRRKVA